MIKRTPAQRRSSCALTLWASLCSGLLIVALTASAACTSHQIAKPSGRVHIRQAWSPTAPPVIKAHAGYFTIINHSTQSRVVIGASSPHYHHVAMHRTTHINGVASMQAVDTIPLAAGEQVQFAPGGLHLMMMQAKHHPQAGDAVPVVLHFENGDQLAFEMTVKPFQQAGHDSDSMGNHAMHQHHRHDK